jgi:hypothetical protein
LLTKHFPTPERFDIAKLKAEMRLRAREAELVGLIELKRSEAEKLWEKLRNLESNFSSVPGQHDPVILSGRVARRYIRFLLRASDIFNLPDNDIRRIAKLAEVRELIGVNMSRLRRFSGADRVGVMVDLARLHSTIGEHDAARGYAEEARIRAFSGSVSHAGKLDVLAVAARVYLRSIDASIDNPVCQTQLSEWLDRAGKAAHDLEILAESNNYRPALGVAYMMGAWCLIAEHQFVGRGVKIISQRHNSPIADADAKLVQARNVMVAIDDHSLDETLDELEIRIQELNC